MGMYLNPGNGMFQRALDRKFYVDKTGLASFLNERMGTDDALVCVSRPRRFGKSVDADMLVAYYTRGADSRAQFEGLSVSRDPSFEEHLNAHDVIKIDMTEAMSGTTDAANIGASVTAAVLPEIRAAWPDAVPENKTYLCDALAYAAMAKGSGFVFVIDEWDLVMREAADDKVAQNDYLLFLRLLLKDVPYVDAAYIEGEMLAGNTFDPIGVKGDISFFWDYTLDERGTPAHFRASER